MDIGPQSKSDNDFTRKYRLLQSKYRTETLKAPYGIGPKPNSKFKFGNMLVNGEKTGLNFISDNAFKYAKQKVLDKQINEYLTIDEFRLYNNMLSSMPMCFNLFSDLRALLLDDQEEVSRIIRSMFNEIIWINKVVYIDVEFIPIPISDYTNDWTAFDAMIIVENLDGEKGIVSIETKYTDILGSNTSKWTSLKDKIIENNKVFDSQLVSHLKEKGYQQIHRNYLLTYAYAKKHKFKHFANVVVSLNDDSTSTNEIEELQEHLLQENDTIMKIALEDIVDRGILSVNELISCVLINFKVRYFGDN